MRVESPLGDLAVVRGLLSLAQLQACLDFQAAECRRGAHKRLGEILVELGYLRAEQVEALVREQRLASIWNKFHDYEILAKLGEGSVGTVLKARRLDSGDLVAIKVLGKRLAAREDYLERFHKEAELGRQLEHPNLVKCLAAGESAGFHYFVQEYVDGEDLRRMLPRVGSFAEPQALELAYGAAQGVAAAHERGLLHRDLKPANLMLARDGTAKVLDFGLARPAGESELDFTFAGTPHYLAPEVLESRDDIDARTDVYGLGVTLFHSLAGRPPFLGANLMEILHAYLTEEVPDPRKFQRVVSAGAAKLVRRMCARDRRERFGSMREVARELENLLGGAMAERQARANFVEKLRCPRCAAPYLGDPNLLAKGVRLRCESCGLVYSCQEEPPAKK